MQKHVEVEITEQHGYKFLWIDGHMWMWDLPFEVETQRKMAEQCHGSVLVVGLGLCVIHRFLEENPDVDSVYTVEKYKEVLDVCDAHGLVQCGTTCICDFFEWKSTHNFDFVVGDIWPEIDSEQVDSYFLFQKKAKEFLKKDGKILAWGKDYYEYLLGRSYDYNISSNGKHWLRNKDD